MRFITIILVIWCALILGGCSVDLEAARAELAKLEQQSKELRDYVAKNQAVLDQLKALAAATGDQTFIDAAAKIEVGLSQAAAKLPDVEATLKASQEKLGQLEKDAEGKVPWYSVVGVAVWTLLPRLTTLIPVIGPYLSPLAALMANMHWNVAATKKQKEDDAGQKT